MGVGHLVRCLALADELRARGVDVVLLGEVPGPAWVVREVARRGLPTHPPPSAPEALVARARALGVDAVVLDGYHLPPGTGSALRADGIPVLAIVDGDFGADQDADLYLDQNLAASGPPRRPAGSRVLAGLGHALFRDDVLARRRAPGSGPDRTGGDGPDRADRPDGSGPRVLCVFGGSDATGAAPDVVPVVLRTGLPVHVLVVAARPELRARLLALAPGAGQRVEVLDPRPDLAALAVTCDAAVTAAGSSVWELLCLGVPAALVRVADNQETGYRTAVARGVAVGLGAIEELRSDGPAAADAVDALTGLLTDATARAALARRGAGLVDGRGRARVADALLALVAARGGPTPDPPRVPDGPHPPPVTTPGRAP
jgi:spore coat polysaccharide biosynthesis predicted glycosyltransferase SpsG